MMSVLFREIDWGKVKSVGFDLDGTLYDEFEFIIQPYSEISNLFIENSLALSFMSERWLKKGSSYNKIFEETYDRFLQKNQISKEKFISSALSIFRDYNPRIILSQRVRRILEYCKIHYKIFLVSDGNAVLQKKKFVALGLDQYFDDGSVVFTGIYSKDFEKPNVKSIELLNVAPKDSMFFGDRDNDMNYARFSGMQFQKVYNMIKVL